MSTVSEFVPGLMRLKNAPVTLFVICLFVFVKEKGELTAEGGLINILLQKGRGGLIEDLE